MATANLGRVGFVNKGAHNIVTTYKVNDVVTYNSGIYACIQEHTGQLPTETAYWQNWVANDKALDSAVVHKTGDETIAGVKTFSSSPISSATQSTAVNALTRKDYVDGLDSANVKLTGDETIAGVKTFSSGINLQNRNVSPFSGFKNYIINGNFDVWQRGISQTCTSAAYQYGSVDRFCLVNTEATNYTISRVPTDGTEPFSADYFVRNVVPLNTTSGIVLDQHIENLKRFSNKTVTLSMWVKGDAGKKIGFGYQAVYGTGGTPSAPDNILGKIFILTGSWQKIIITTTIPDVITGKTYGTNNDNYLRISISFSSGSTTYIPEIFLQAGTFDIAQVQLEEGSVATPFENRPYGLELSLCQRYYETGEAWIIGSGHAVGVFVSGNTFFKVYKRVIPTLTMLSATENANFSATVTTPVNQYGFRYYGLVTAPGNAYITRGYAASAEL